MISTVSIFGVDDSVSPADLADISQQYPFVEWGFNLCSNAEPMPSYPSDEWLSELLFHTDRVRLRGVLRGRWERDMLDGNLSLKVENPQLWEALRRVQVDITRGHRNLIDAIQLISDKEIVLSAKDSYTITVGLNTTLLFPKEQLFTYKGYCGYSILEGDIDLILGRKENNFWVSVEGFRDDDGITMDLLKVEKFLDQAEDFVTSDSMIKALLETEEVKRRFSEHP